MNVDGTTREVQLRAGKAILSGTLAVPSAAKAMVLFAHGSGSSRFSPRNRFVAATLNDVGIGTFLFDLLTAEEEEIDLITGELRFDVEFLAGRLLAASAWVMQQDATRLLHLGYFGASTGAAAALIAAAQLPRAIQAIVCRGGRPDMAASVLASGGTHTANRRRCR